MKARGRHGLLLVVFSLGEGCTQPEQMQIQIPFEARIGNRLFSCQADGAPAANQFVPNDLRLYVHDVELVNAAGQVVPLTLDQDGVFQAGAVVLLDFEDGSGNCENGTTTTHTAIAGRVARDDYRALRFTLGVPFAVNHADPGTANPPLNLGRMHWGWQAGYKFLRFEGTHGTGTGVRFHLGSTGCEGTIGHITDCARPNRVPIALSDFHIGQSRVMVQLDTLLASLDTTRTRSCMADIDAADCVPMFAAIGIDLASGGPARAQMLFQLGNS